MREVGRNMAAALEEKESRNVHQANKIEVYTNSD